MDRTGSLDDYCDHSRSLEPSKTIGHAAAQRVLDVTR
jgi:hypothetical protein